MANLKIVPLELREANDLVARLHRHHKPVQGHRFSIGCINRLPDADDVLVGAAIVGRPVSGADPKSILEVTRLVTDGTEHACSKLYGACARIGKELGYKKIQTYILSTEPGTSLKAAGWVFDGMSKPAGWSNGSRKGNRKDDGFGLKQRWMKILNT